MSRLAALRARLSSEVTPSAPTILSSLSASVGARPLSPALVDTFGRAHTYVRLSITERCNLRCSYCMPEDGVPLTSAQDLLTPTELIALARTLVRLGVTKLRLTGGEPTVRKDIVDIVRALSALRADGLRTLALTSNGVLLGADGGARLRALRAAGLDALNLSLDTLDPLRFARLSRRPAAAHAAARAAVDLALGAGFGGRGSPPLKVNAVILRGENDGELPDLVTELTRTRPIALRVIEHMPFAGLEWSRDRVLTAADLTRALSTALPEWHAVEGDVDSALGGTVGRQYRGGVGWAGTVGFVSTVSDAFCSTCSRLRLTADGALRACLHSERETSLRDILRAGGGDAGIEAAVAAAVQGKARALGGATLAERAKMLKEGGLDSGRGMVRIGG